MAPNTQKQSVLIVKADPAIRSALTQLLERSSNFSVLDAVENPFVAAQVMAQQAPDLLLLGLGMKRMSGRDFLKKVMSQYPMPVVICAHQLDGNPSLAAELRDLGAAGLIVMPKHHGVHFLKEKSTLFLRQLQAALTPPRQPTMHRPRHHTPNSKFSHHAEAPTATVNKSRPPARGRTTHSTSHPPPKHTADVILPPPTPGHRHPRTEPIIVIGASTGGVEALTAVLKILPADLPGIVIVQHLPGHFSDTLITHLDNCTPLKARLARDGEPIQHGMALLAPGDCHTLLKRQGRSYAIRLVEGPPVRRHRPAAEVLFRSAAIEAGPNAIGIIMTGMGDDGARGMREMFDAGAQTIAQDEASCTVFGMPKEAIALGGVRRIIALESMAEEIIRLSRTSP
ncbi:MAG: response regulator [Magnetococcales bacterium]|nr:response regulator [Magnetococcales bacterium]